MRKMFIGGHMSSYITERTVFSHFYQFPDFLLRAPISQTAKLAYMLLYDRARLSQQNEWQDDGRVYLTYPIKNMAAALGKSESTVKDVFNELRGAGLLKSEDGGFSKPNNLFVLIPDSSRIAQWLGKAPSIGREKDTDDSLVSVPTEDSLSAPNKVIEIGNKNQVNRVNQRSVFGFYENIYLFQEEYDRLKGDFPSRIDSLIEEMSAYCKANGKKYQNYEAALRSWAKREKSTGNTVGAKPGFPDYSCEEGESF